MIEKLQQYYLENIPKSGYKKICCECVEDENLSKWIKDHGNKGQCDFDQSHKSFNEVVLMADFIREFDNHFYESYVEGNVQLFPVPDSEETDYIQQGRSFAEILQDDFFFGDAVSEAIIENLGYDENYEKCSEVEERERLDRYEFEASLIGPPPIVILDKNLSSLSKLLEIKISSEAQKKFHLMMIFSFCITALETYLSDIFKREIMSSQSLKSKYLKAVFKKDDKIEISQIYEKYEKMDDFIKENLGKISFHNLGRVKPLYKAVLGLNLADVGSIMRLIKKRHDFVHRGGKNEDGEDVFTNRNEIEGLIKEIRIFCNDVDKQMKTNALI